MRAEIGRRSMNARTYVAFPGPVVEAMLRERLCFAAEGAL